MSDDLDTWGSDDLPGPEELAATDALFDALADGRPAGTDPTVELLASLRASLDDRLGLGGLPPAPVVPITAARGTARRRVGRSAVAGLVVAGVAFSGTGVAAALSSQPGDFLYPVRTAIAGPVNDNNNRMVTRIIATAQALDTAPVTGATKTQGAALINTAAKQVPGIKDPGRRRTAVKKLQQVEKKLGLPPSPIPTTVPSPTPTPSPSPLDVSVTPGGTPTVSPAPGVLAPASPSVTGTPSASPSRHRHPKPSKSPRHPAKPTRSPKPSRSPKASPSVDPSPSASPRASRSPRTPPPASPETSSSPDGPASSRVASDTVSPSPS